MAILPGADSSLLRADTSQASVGEVTANKPLVHVFHLENTGTKPLTIVDVRRTCACAKYDLGEKSLAPGQKTALRVNFNLLTQPEGPGQWNVGVVYAVEGREEKAELALSVSAKVKKDVWVEPVSLVMIGEKDLSGLVTVFDRRGKALTVTGARLGVDQVTSKVDPANVKDVVKHQAIRLTVGENLPVGSYVDELAIDTDDPEYREIRIPVRIVKKAPVDAIQAVPASVMLRGIGASKLATLRDREDREIDLESVSASEKFLSVKWARGPGNDATVRITLNGQPEQVTGTATVIVKTKLPAARAISILVEWSK